MEIMIPMPIFIISMLVVIIMTAGLVLYMIKNKYKIVFNSYEMSKKEILVSNEFKTYAENSYLKGLEAGRKEAFESFSFIVEPYYEVTDNFFKKQAISGFQTTIYLKGFPICEPTRREFQKIEKFKDENLEKLLATIENNVNKFAEVIAACGIPIKVLETKKTTTPK